MRERLLTFMDDGVRKIQHIIIFFTLTHRGGDQTHTNTRGINLRREEYSPCWCDNTHLRRWRIRYMNGQINKCLKNIREANSNMLRRLGCICMFIEIWRQFILYVY